MESFTHIVTFNAYIIYIQEMLKRVHKRVLIDKISIYCSMNKQYMKG